MWRKSGIQTTGLSAIDYYGLDSSEFIDNIRICSENKTQILCFFNRGWSKYELSKNYFLKEDYKLNKSVSRSLSRCENLSAIPQLISQPKSFFVAVQAFGG
jgi:hypothetical protein